MPHTEIKIIDDEGRTVPRGVPGELCTRGYCVMRGYWDDPEKTAEEIDAAGWIRTGDIARMDAAGSLAIKVPCASLRAHTTSFCCPRDKVSAARWPPIVTRTSAL